MKPFGSLDNYISIQRRQSGLSRDELECLLDDERGNAILYEELRKVPTLAHAIGLSLIFKEPVHKLFAGLTEKLRDEIAARARTLSKQKSDKVTAANAQKLEALYSISQMDKEDVLL